MRGRPAAYGITQNIEHVRDRIQRAAQRAGRDPRAIRLVVVTKSVDPARIRPALAAGVTILGENRLQEALPKINELGSENHAWHFIGRLQRRKVKSVVGLFEMIHSVDSVELAAEIERIAAAAGVMQHVLLEVNVAGEPSKGGFSPDALVANLPALGGMPHVAVKGLMTIPPRGPDGESARPYFRQLRALAQRLDLPEMTHIELSELSMGMSQDYEVAVEEGATMVRVGTAIFGERHV